MDWNDHKEINRQLGEMYIKLRLEHAQNGYPVVHGDADGVYYLFYDDTKIYISGKTDEEKKIILDENRFRNAVSNPKNNS